MVLNEKQLEARRLAGRKGGAARTEKTKLRGFGSMSPERRREIGARGGAASKAKREELLNERQQPKEPAPSL